MGRRSCRGPSPACAIPSKGRTMSLLSKYCEVDLFALREAGLRAFKPSEVISTYSLEYFVEYTTLCADEHCKECAAQRFHPGIHFLWNVRKYGLPTRGNLGRWARQHEFYALPAEIMVIRAAIRRCNTGEVICDFMY